MPFCYIIRGDCNCYLVVFLYYHLNIELFAMPWIPDECFFLVFLCSVLMNVLENIHAAYIFT